MAEKIYANIELLSTPIDNEHIVNKAYVDNKKLSDFTNDMSYQSEAQVKNLINNAQQVGVAGKSAYEVAVNEGFEGSPSDWIASLKGDDGKSAYQTWLDAGNIGDENDFLESLNGKSAYEIAKDNGYADTEENWVNSLKGDQGKSAYELWKEQGNTGSENDFINSLKAIDGKSAYDYWLEAGNSGDEATFVASLKGEKGENGYSPSTTVEQLSTGAKITITDKDGTTTALAKNGVGIASTVKSGTTGKVDTYTINYTDGTTSFFTVTNGSGDEINKVSQLDNDSGFITNIVDNLLNYYTKDNTYTKTEVEDLIGRMNGGLSLKITNSLNDELIAGVSTSTIYLIETAEGSGVYTQYIWMSDSSSWAMIGTTAVDLSNYYNKSEIDNKLSLYASITFVTTLLSNYTTTANLATVALSNDYNDLNNLPTIPSIDGLASETYVNTAVSNLSDSVSTTYRKTADKVPYADVSDTPTLATVATSGSYNDLSDKPTIPSAITIDDALSASSTNPVQNKVIQTALAGKQNTLTIDTTLSTVSTNPVQNKIITTTLNKKLESVPTASASTAGIIKVGSGLNINSDGVLSATGSIGKYDVPLTFTFSWINAANIYYAFFPEVSGTVISVMTNMYIGSSAEQMDRYFKARWCQSGNKAFVVVPKDVDVSNINNIKDLATLVYIFYLT